MSSEPMRIIISVLSQRSSSYYGFTMTPGTNSSEKNKESPLTHHCVCSITFTTAVNSHS